MPIGLLWGVRTALLVIFCWDIAAGSWGLMLHDRGGDLHAQDLSLPLM